MATGSISSAGIGSGLDVASIIASLMKVERQPLTRLQQAEATMQTKLSAFGQIQSLVSSFRDAAAALQSSDLFSQTTAGTSDATSVTAGTTAKAVPGLYALSVTSLAASQSVVGPAGQFAAPDAPVGTGTLAIRLGTWDAARTTFTPKTGSSDITVAIGTGDNSLALARDKINAANAGVVASIVTDANGPRLSIQSSESGAANGFRITAADDDGANDDAAGLSRLTYDGANGGQLAFARGAANAAATINGIAVEGTGNTLSNVIEGMTFNLQKLTTPGQTVNVTVTRNAEASKAAVARFVQAYNQLDATLTDATKYDAASKQGAILQGDATTVGLQSRLRQLVAQTSPASSAFPSLSALGVQLQKDGTLKIDDTKLAAAVANPAEFKKAFSNVDTAAPSNNGIGKRFALWADEQLSVKGNLSGKQKAVQARIEAMQKDQEKMADRLERTEDRLKTQYAKLDTVMSKANALQSYVKQQFYFEGNKND
jgi:flagellar hook-associated protein 2